MMHLNLKVILQWFGLLLGLGSIEVQHISQAVVEELLGRFYIQDGIWIREAVYLPSLEVLQVVSQIPSADYLPSAPHVNKEQYVRVQSQAAVLMMLLSDHVPQHVRQMSFQEASDNLYYRQEWTRWRRLIRPGDPFVCQFHLSVRDIRGSTELTVQMADGPFEGRIQAVYVPTHSSAEAEEALEQNCYTIWQTIVNRLVSKFAFALARPRLTPFRHAIAIS